MAGIASLMEKLEAISDPRMARARRHRLADILGLAVLAEMCGAEGWEDIEVFGHARIGFLRRFLYLDNGTPSHDTISRVFRLIRPEVFDELIRDWLGSLEDVLGVKLVAIDGKTLRRSFERKTARKALHLVSAWCVGNHVVLGQVATDEKSNEITAIPALLAKLALGETIVTIDAMECQKDIAEQIVEQGGDYVLAVKDNQPTLHQALKEHADLVHSGEPDVKGREWTTHDKGHGRIERRYFYIAPIPDSMRKLADEWHGMQEHRACVFDDGAKRRRGGRSATFHLQPGTESETVREGGSRALGDRERTPLDSGRYLSRR